MRFVNADYDFSFLFMKIMRENNKNPMYFVKNKAKPLILELNKLE